MTSEHLSETDIGEAENDKKSTIVSRRRLLKVGGATTFVGLAGCGGDGGGDGDGTTTTTTTDGNGNGNGDDTTTTTTTQGEPLDSAFTGHFGRARPSEIHWNPYNSTNSLVAGINSPQHVMWDQLMVYNSKSGEWVNRLLDDLTVDGTTVTMTLSSDHQWSNGDPVQAADLVTNLQIAKYLEYPIWNFVDDVAEVDQQTVELTLTEETSAGVVRQQANRRLTTKASVYGRWVDDFENASGQDEVDSVIQELTSWEYAPADSDEMPLTNGPFKLDRITDTKIWLVQDENYPVQTNFEEYEYQYRTGTDSDQAAIADQLDGIGIGAQREQITSQFPEHFTKVEIPEYGVTCLYIQNDHEMLGDRHVRQAFAHLIDAPRVVKNSNPRVRPSEVTAWLSNGQAEQWLGDQYDAYTQYFPGSHPDMAAEKMREAGFEKNGSNWTDSSGNSFQFSIKTPPWSAPLGVAKTVSDQLSDFGVTANVQQQESSNWISDAQSGEFTLRGGYWGGGPHPYFAFTDFTGSNLEACNIPLQVDLPPVGEPGGSTSSFDVKATVASLPTTTDEAELAEKVQKLGWYANQFMPSVPITVGVIPTWYTTDEWNFPDPEQDANMYLPYPMSQMLKETAEGSDMAKLTAKTE